LEAVHSADPVVLLIDEVDRADEEFEAFLLELLADFQISIPELGTIRARSIPRVVLTSNATRELSDALRRRCLYHYLEYPTIERESAILRARLPGLGIDLAGQVARLVAAIRKEQLRKTPGVAESLDWAGALLGLGIGDLSEAPETLYETLVCVLKTHEDRAQIDRTAFSHLIAKVA
ncbi:MAG TPA: MoxR family ATPase, partial [Acetobacteraceae bacterium]|nr:MoxR family ATPase [Acetobacteraceae bacterium]